MQIKAGDYVRTPRFLNVKIENVFPNKEKLFENGYNEPTHFKDEDFVVYGKSIGINRMIFAAAYKH